MRDEQIYTWKLEIIMAKFDSVKFRPKSIKHYKKELHKAKSKINNKDLTVMHQNNTTNFTNQKNNNNR